MSSQSISTRRLPCRTLVLLVALAVLGWANVGLAKVDCDPNKEYAVSPEAGAWMVIVQTYSGDMARDQAHKLVLELRARYNLPAYVFNRGKEQKEKQEEEIRQRREQMEKFLRENNLQPGMPFRTPRMRIDEEYAVLVGDGYKDMESAAKARDRMRKLPTPSKELVDSVVVAGLDEKGQPTKQESVPINPFLRAFPVPNPTVPVQKPADKPDPFLKQLNSEEPYSVFSCGKPWTLAVKEFYGENRVVSHNTPVEMIEKLLGKKNGPDTLNASAMQAHELVKVMRKYMNIDAYVLHTRHGSVVTIGAYDSKDDPRLVQNQKRFTNFQFVTQQQGGTQRAPDIKFFPIPLPMEVPKAN
jgi:hypothetical protein